ncbi:MAG: heavy metal-binding domain-containing protein, partial [Candidatus Marinimicrobia bacterium]|nr:heavy metal-binding domain-containing protein [Candidatus Neomarinimicrobiota bacterium]
MIITNTDSVPNREVTEILGVVRGNSVRAKHIGRDLMAGLKGIVG